MASSEASCGSTLFSNMINLYLRVKTFNLCVNEGSFLSNV